LVAQNFDLPAAEYPFAKDTKTFIVERRPGSKLVARPQNLEAFFGCEISFHNIEKKIQLSASTIRRHSDRLVSENLIASHDQSGAKSLSATIWRHDAGLT
jgi:hypothetical protein